MKRRYPGPKVQKIGKRSWLLIEDWVTPYGTVKKDFTSNGANIPRLLWSIMSPAGVLFEASILHDYYYDKAISNKKVADANFYKVAIDFNVGKFKAKLAYYYVKMFGKGNYGKL